VRELLRELEKADERRADGCCYWIEIFGDESGSCFDEYEDKEVFSFTSVREAIARVKELSPMRLN